MSETLRPLGPLPQGAIAPKTGAATLIASLITDLLSATDDLDARIEQALGAIGRFAGADRAYVIRYRDNATYDNTHEWVAEGIAPSKDTLQGEPLSRVLPAILAARDPLTVASIADLPEDEPHRGHLISQGIRSMLVAPMTDDAKSMGVIGFDRVHEEGDFGAEATELLASFAKVLTAIIRRSEIETTAAATHHRLISAVEALPDAFAYFDADDRLVLCNEHYWKVTPAAPSKAELLGMTFEAIIRKVAERRAASNDVADPEAWVAARLASHQTPGEPFLLRLLDSRWVKVLEQQTADGGRVTMLIDVTSEKLSTERLNDTLDIARAGIWERQFHDDDTIIIDDRAARILGYQDAAELGPLSIADWYGRLHPDDFADLSSQWQEPRTAMSTISDHVYRVRHKDGDYVWVMTRGRVVDRGFSWPGRSRIGVIIDITERKVLEADLTAERDYLETVMETSLSAIVALDEDGRFVYSNHAAIDLFGLSEDEIRNRRYDDPDWQIIDLDGKTIDHDDLPFTIVARTGQPVRDFRHAIQGKTGDRLVLSVNAAPVRRPGSPIRVVASMRDITLQLDAENALREAANRAFEATEAKSRFLASMSHEIRTPLNGVLGMAEMLDLELSDPRKKEMLGVIRESGTLLLSIINDILDLSKIEAGKLDLEIAAFDPAILTAAVEAVHSVAARRKGIDLVVLSSVGSDRRRLGDAHRIQQILHNVVSNAIKFTEAGEVTVMLSARRGEPFSIRVRDTGSGIDPGQIERMFQEFEQADQSVARRHGGSGLGLAIVGRLVKLMDGTISVTSKPGVGTDFRISLPLPETEPDARAADIAPAIPSKARSRALPGLRALVAEDNSTNRMILRAMLDRLGIASTFVTDGSEIVDAWAPGRFDLVLLDINMPTMDGMEALQSLRAAETKAGTAPIPAVAITANAMAHQVDSYIAGGFAAHLPKPLDLATLESVLNGVAPAPGGDRPSVSAVPPGS